MRKEMGNQNTSGIVAEERSQEDLKEENKKVSEDDGTKDFQEKDSHDDEADKSPPVEKGSEEANGFVNDCETRSDLEDGIAKLSNEAHDQPCTLKGEIQRSEIDAEQKSSSTIVNSNSVPHEAVDIPPVPQKDQNGIVQESVEVESLGSSNSSHIEEEELLFETCADKEEIGRVRAADSIENVLPRTNLQNLSGNEKKDEFLAVDEEELIGNGRHNMIKSAEEESTVGIDSVSRVENVVLIDEVVENDTTNEVNEMGDLISIAEKQEDKSRNETTFENENNNESETKCSSEIKRVDEYEDTDEAVVSHVPQEVEIPTTVDESQEIKRVVEYENADVAVISQTSSRAVSASCLPPVTQEAEIPTTSDESQEIKRVVEYENTDEAVKTETSSPAALASYLPPVTQEAEIPTTGDQEISFVESSPSCTGVRVELRKSPSFDFGLSVRCEESDQTPLLYQDKTTAMRSLSSCSAVRFQNRSVQTEYLGANTKYEAVEVQEKTITMERSSSEILRISSLNLVAQENGLKGSPSREGNDVISPRGNEKRKPRSSLFTTCICCPTAIS